MKFSVARGTWLQLQGLLMHLSNVDITASSIVLASVFTRPVAKPHVSNPSASALHFCPSLLNKPFTATTQSTRRCSHHVKVLHCRLWCSHPVLLVTPTIGPAIHFLAPSLIRCMRGGLVAGGTSVPSTRAAVGLATRDYFPGKHGDQHETHISPRLSQPPVQLGNQPLKTVPWRMPIVNHPHLHHRARQQRRRAAANKEVARSQQGMTWSKT
ncbi:hypothetical protein HaLaN_23734, partial [Haematococcus lacustris]